MNESCRMYATCTLKESLANVPRGGDEDRFNDETTFLLSSDGRCSHRFLRFIMFWACRRSCHSSKADTLARWTALVLVEAAHHLFDNVHHARLDGTEIGVSFINKVNPILLCTAWESQATRWIATSQTLAYVARHGLVEAVVFPKEVIEPLLRSRAHVVFFKVIVKEALMAWSIPKVDKGRLGWKIRHLGWKQQHSCGVL